MLIYLQMIETEGDKVRFEQLYDKYRGLMYDAAFRILQNEHDAEDAVHQAFLSLIRHFDKVSRVDCLKTRSYIVITVERKAIDIIRANKKYTELYADSLPGLEIPLPGEDPLSDAMAALPARYREVLLLRYAHGYTQKELCGILGMSGGGVQKLLWRAKKALQEEMKEEDGQ